MVDAGMMVTLTLRTQSSSPYAVLAAQAGSVPEPQRKRSLLSMSRIAEARTLSSPAGALILAVLQESEHYTAATAGIYQGLARRGVQVVLFAHGWSDVSVTEPGLHLVGLAEDDVARDEWDVLVCSPRRRFGFASLDTHEPYQVEMDRTFTWLTSQDETAIGKAANALLNRIPTHPLKVPTLSTT